MALSESIFDYLNFKYIHVQHSVCVVWRLVDTSMFYILTKDCIHYTIHYTFNWNWWWKGGTKIRCVTCECYSQQDTCSQMWINQLCFLVYFLPYSYMVNDVFSDAIRSVYGKYSTCTTNPNLYLHSSTVRTK